VGLARSGAAAARLLWARGEPVIGVDARDPPEADALRAEGMEIHTGVDGLAELTRARALVKSPGVPPGAPVIAQARAAGIPVMGELELGWRLLPHAFIAVTGTNGKTTTTELLGAILRAAGRDVVVAGNVGTPLTSLAGLAPQATVVCEASSYQLHDAVAFAPDVGVILNLTPDHLPWHGTLEAYRDAKLRLFAHQPQWTTAIGPAELLGAARGEAVRVTVGERPVDDVAVRHGAIWWRGERLADIASLRLRGAHNAWNAAAAAAAALVSGVDAAVVRDALARFPGVEHRLEEVRTLDGVTWINDSKSTNVAATLVALEAIDAPVHLILGGEAKGQDFGVLRDAVAGRAAAVHLIGESADVIAQALDGAGTAVYHSGDLATAVDSARGTARAAEVVLLSPACASFDQFADYEARGRAFKALVAAL
jgi:UDP-N-acetylmuramoylalanine--D-glutamate ligase